MKTISTIIVFAIVVGIFIFMLWRRRQKETNLLNDREPLSDDEIYMRYYAIDKLPKALVLQLWHEVSCTLKVPAPKLRPEDRFDKEVGAYWITSEYLDELAAKGRERAKKFGLTVDLEEISTVDAYIRSFARTSEIDEGGMG